MNTENVSAVQFGRLLSSVETLVDTMKLLQDDLNRQRETNAQLQVRITGLEQKLDTSTAELVDLKKAFSDTRALILKISFAVGVSATGATAGISKVFGIFGS